MVAVFGFAHSLCPGVEPDFDRFHDTVKPFLADYCQSCHGPDRQKAEVRVDTLTPVGQGTSGDLWKHILDQIEFEDMPPEDETQPAAEELEDVVAWIRDELIRARAVAASTGGQVVLRRLNRSEYGETLRRLLHLHPSIDPAKGLPDDASHEGFDNVGSVLTTSSRLLELYLDTSERMLEIALPRGPAPETHRKRLEGEVVTQEWIEEFVRRKNRTREMFESIRDLDRDTREYTETRERIRELISEHLDRLPRDEALQFGGDDLGLLSDGKGLTVRQGVRLKLARFGVPNDVPGVYRATGRIRGVAGKNGNFPIARVTFEKSFENVDLWSRRLSDDVVEFSVESYIDDRLGHVHLDVAGEEGDSTDDPGIWVDYLQIEGPLAASPTPARRTIFGKDPTEADAPDILSRFARKAFRRPVKPERLEQFVDFYEERRQAGASFELAVRDTLTAMLVAPEFLFLLEPKESGSGRVPLDEFELATRLSYFLWGGPPDEELDRLAREGRLSKPGILRGQVARMIEHKRAERFAENFAGQWLRLRELGTVEPDPRKYPEYNRHIESAMRRETERFFLHILREDLPIRTLVDSDFTFLNRDLARLYGVEGVNGAEVEFVHLPENSHRGGVLTQASILTLTSDGVRTSPVKRGTYILERLLGDPPPPPPPDVPPVPESKGDTLKERLKSHRQLKACANCHDKIDPIGFALENFNAIGKWREEERESRQPIDPSGEWADAGTFSGYREFLDLLLKREEDLEHCLTEMMLIYAVGRPIDFSDDPHLEVILENVRADGGKLSSLVTEIVLSELFLTK